jgi:hypothetical protein
MSTEVISVPSLNHAARAANFFNHVKEEILTELAEIERGRQDLMELLANIEAKERRKGYNLDNAPPVRKDEFRGVRAVQALESYLRIRRGFRVPLSRIVKDLVEGGVDPGQPRGSKNDPAGLVAHTLKIAVPNRRDVFGYEPAAVNEKTGAHVIPKGIRDEDILVWLADTADQPRRRKRP